MSHRTNRMTIYNEWEVVEILKGCLKDSWNVHFQKSYLNVFRKRSLLIKTHGRSF